ncbi:MAG: arginine N-succinyltransferase, partial [Phycisphaerales bacterium]
MFLVRRAKPEDTDTLQKLAKMVHFINLPPDREIIAEKIGWSRNCFLLAADEEAGMAQRARSRRAPLDAREHGALSGGLRNIAGQSPLFMFVLEELETQGVIGTSQIIARMGGPGQPNISLQLSRKEMWSQSLQMGVTHTVAKMYKDETGPTEIGGLILQPSFRGHRQKLGRLIAIVRFHFMALHRELFSDRVLAEMMGPISPDGENPFWDHCTRCFINLTYD